MSVAVSFLSFWYYFVANVFGFNIIPRFIYHGGYEWFSLLLKEGKVWCLCYSRFEPQGFEPEYFIKKVGKSKYILYLKMVYELWKRRKDISFSIDDY